MKINKIRLQNIKSYIDLTIKFYDGVNFISGMNGSGKSTIIESIGYALFDVKPYDFKEFIRYGQSTGTISVWFEANDEREYCVIRKFARNRHISWAIFDVETNSELDLHGPDDVKGWLRDNLGMDKDTDPNKLFRDIVGVRQGTFTAPFLLSAQNRSDLFNPILKLDSYRNAFKKTSDCESLLNNKIKDLQHNIQLEEQRIEGYEDRKNELKETIQMIQQLNEEITKRKDAVKRSKDRYNELKAIKNRISEREQNSKRLKLEISNVKEQIAQIDNDIEKATVSEEIAKETEVGYRRYIQLQTEIKQLQSQVKKRDALNKAKEKLERECVALRAEIQSSKSNYESSVKDLMERLENLKKERLEQELERNIASEIMKEKFAIDRNVQILGEGLDLLKKVNMDINAILLQVDSGLNGIEAQKQEIKRLNEECHDYESYRSLADRLPSLRRELETKKKLEAQIETEIRTAQKNMKMAKGGKCPFLGEDCKNVEGNLEEFFALQVMNLQERLEPISAEVNRIQSEIEIAEKALQTVAKLEQKRQFIESIKDHIKQTESNILNLSLSLDTQRIEETLNFVESKLPSDGKSKSILEALSRLEKLPSTDGGIPEIKRFYECLSSAFKDYLDTILPRFKELSSDAQEGIREASNQLEKIETRIENIDKSIQETEKQLFKLGILNKEIKEKETLLANKASEVALKEQELLSYQGIDEKIEQLQDEQSRCIGDYNRYIENKKMAELLPELLSRREERLKKLLSKEIELKALEDELKELNAMFSLEEFERLEAEMVDLQRKLSQLETTLNERNADREKLVKEIYRMEQIKQNIAKLKDDLSKYNNTLEMLKFIRNDIFNQAGDKIAHVYRQKISAEANKIYREISKENVTLEWEEDYEICLISKGENGYRRRVFSQLSGGEQMSAALAVRLALLEMLSKIKIGIFDEPTTNMDEHRRLNLAQVIPTVTKNFQQLFIISHDDSFDSITDNVIRLIKTETEGTMLAIS